MTAGPQTVAIRAVDGNGNVTNKNYQLTVTNGNSRTLSYDLNGNLLSNGNGQTFSWDAEGRLVQISQGGGTTGFTYDAFGRRTSETLNGTTIKQWVWVGPAMVEERDGSNNVTKRFYSEGEQIAGTNLFYTRDHLGSIREMIDSTGAIRARYDFDPYGRATKIQGDLSADFQFAGYYMHSASGLLLTLYRVYDPNLGRWISRDPLATGDISLYNYVANNPISGIDPFGLQQWGDGEDKMLLGLYAYQAMGAPTGTGLTIAGQAVSAVLPAITLSLNAGGIGVGITGDGNLINTGTIKRGNFTYKYKIGTKCPPTVTANADLGPVSVSATVSSDGVKFDYSTVNFVDPHSVSFGPLTLSLDPANGSGVPLYPATVNAEMQGKN